LTDILLKELHQKLIEHFKAQQKNWNSFVYAKNDLFYQGFDEIELEGCRSSEKRFEQYVITKYLNSNQTVLDIGCNCGFFTLLISKFIGKIEGVDINPYLINIANDTKEFLKIKNAKFFASSFEEYMPEKKYDLIFSLANDETVDGNTKFTFKEYVKKILDYSKKNALLIFETTARDTYYSESFEPKLTHLEDHFEFLEDKIIESEYPANISKRRFLILKKL
jgi:SAM-dependent methyltransferase